MGFRLLQVVLLLSLLIYSFALPSADVCLQQLDEGPCDGDSQRWYYNTITQECEEFQYGGCLGNDNNFRTFERCKKTCWRIPKVPRICRLSKEEGVGRAYLRRYFFNMATMECELFIYGGINGNGNNFDSMASCEEYCRPQRNIPQICNRPLDKGTCVASIPRFYFDPASRSCEEFQYTGCGGNSNNFISREGCTRVCVQGMFMKSRMQERRKIRLKISGANRPKF
ncbi:tissue factor pathway inhibitor 2 [Brienomyrus brachyistius]|uniref:tissue factor pathway inhibitor 2 n=1 Tax=Brienomyrus brachyistius TaxID=42636 RepID=UPI0020B3AA24|nr:tissue factor pathway inhibitor 2 [Brienomyrus brachyistius]